MLHHTLDTDAQHTTCKLLCQTHQFFVAPLSSSPPLTPTVTFPSRGEKHNRADTHLLRGPIPQLRPGRSLPGGLLRLELRRHLLHAKKLRPCQINPNAGSSLPCGYSLQVGDGVGFRLVEEDFYRLPPAADCLVHRVPLLGVDLDKQNAQPVLEKRPGRPGVEIEGPVCNGP